MTLREKLVTALVFEYTLGSVLLDALGKRNPDAVLIWLLTASPLVGISLLGIGILDHLENRKRYRS